MLTHKSIINLDVVGTGKKVVSVSRTPGHTKHFQTIFLTNTVCLCDCPGLVFPSTVPKQLQILMGSFPIAQVKEPYTTVKFLAERLDLPRILKLQHQENDDTWSAMDICDAWAAKRKYLTARTARFDCYRSANSLLRIALEGKICVYAYPPGWSSEKGIHLICHTSSILVALKWRWPLIIPDIHCIVRRKSRNSYTRICTHIAMFYCY